MYDSFKPSTEKLIALAQSLIQIRSENGLIGEDAVRKFLEEILAPCGFHIVKQSYMPGRTNMIAVYEPHPRARLILFSGHMDTVVGFSANNSDTAEYHDGMIFGRGACDMKGPIAAFLFAALQWLDNNPSYFKSHADRGFALAFTVDEEVGCKGMVALDSPEMQAILKRVDYCILAEPSELSPLIGHKGIAWYKVTFHGTAAHASTPALGDNAIYKAVEFVQRLQAYYKELQKITSPLGSPALNVGIIHGGEATNIVPNLCEVSVDRRFVPGENMTDDLTNIRKFAIEIDPASEIETGSPGEAYFLPEGKQNSIYRQIAPLCSKITETWLPAYTEADPYFRQYKIPVIILGPGSIRQAHQTPEFISVADLDAAVGIYTRILERYLTGGK